MPHLLSGSTRPAPSGTTKQLILFLHGLGADGNDLISLAPYFQAVFPDATCLSPNAPFPCDMAPVGYQWFSLQDRAPSIVEAGVAKAAPILNQYIDAQLEAYALDDSAVAVVGFSQGTMMALYTLLRRPNPCAAIVGYSGALVAADTSGTDITSRPPICLVHGTADMVVPFTMMEQAKTSLERNTIPVTAHARPGLEHGIDEEGLRIALAHLKQHLHAKTPAAKRA